MWTQEEFESVERFKDRAFCFLFGVFAGVLLLRMAQYLMKG
jgi:hypothetical protein